MTSELEERLANGGGWGSLAPGRARAHLPSELAAPGSSLHGALTRIAQAIVENHPDNLFADLDALAATLERLDEPCRLERTDRIVRLHALFGQRSPIRFRYVHDFLYGFDWARWVARAPEERHAVLPYDLPFLAYLEQRGHELLALIAGDDAKYPTLRDRSSRNPFPFSREPAAEIAIHRALAERGLVPLAAWDASAAPHWNEPYASVREAQARAMGLELPPVPLRTGPLHASLRKDR
jgi:hypothetical protein